MNGITQKQLHYTRNENVATKRITHLHPYQAVHKTDDLLGIREKKN